MHAKVAVIDGAWSTVGSSNFDGLSLPNHEANILIQTNPLAPNPRYMSDLPTLSKLKRITLSDSPGILDSNIDLPTSLSLGTRPQHLDNIVELTSPTSKAL